MRSTPKPRPFLKWVGGKRQLLPKLAPHIPARFGDYHEAMLGGGALFFDLAGKGLLADRRAHLSDANERLVRTWRGVQQNVEHVLFHLTVHAEMHAVDPDRHFAVMRAAPPDNGTDAEMAAWFIYLNRAGFNGLYRVNRRGQVNTPRDTTRDVLRFDADNLRRCSDALAVAVLRTESFTGALRAEPDDLAYFDPPYVPVSVTARFTSYTADGFGVTEHIRLRDTARTLARRGVHVLASNADVPWVRTAYGKGFALEEVTARRAVNSDAKKRGPVGELVIRGVARAKTGARGRHVLLCDELGRTECGGVR